MKRQFTSFVALAFFYGSVTSTPIPIETTSTGAPSIADAFMNTGGRLASTLFQAAMPSSAFDGAVSAAGACLMNNGQMYCPRDVESDEAAPSIADSFMNTGGRLISTLFQSVTPGSAFDGAVSAAGACVMNNGQMYCPRDSETDEAAPSIADAFMNTGGRLASTLFQAAMPSSVFDGAVSAAGACLMNNGQMYCPGS